jgi:hypothetical protein
MPSFWKKHDLSPDKQDAGFIGAIVCDLGDFKLMRKLYDAVGNDYYLKGQLFFIGAVDVNVDYGTMLFGLMPPRKDGVNE